MPDAVQDFYLSPEGDVYAKMVPEKLGVMIKESENGVRLYAFQAHEYGIRSENERFQK